MSDDRRPSLRFRADGSVQLMKGEHAPTVDLAAFSADGSMLLTVREVGVAQVRRTVDEELVSELRPTSPLEGTSAGPTTDGFRIFIESVALSPDGALALLGLNDGTAGLYRTSDCQRLAVLHHPDRQPAEKWDAVRAVAFSADGGMSLAGFSDGGVGVWDLAGHRLRFLVPPEPSVRITRGPFRGEPVTGLAPSTDGRRLFVAHVGRSVEIRDLDTGAVVLAAHEHNETVVALQSGQGAVRWATDHGNVWDALPGEEPRKVLAAAQGWAEVTFHPDGRSLLARSPEGVFRWGLDGAGQPLASCDAEIIWGDRTTTLGFDPAGDRWFYPEAVDGHVIETAQERIHLRTDAPGAEMPLEANAQELLRKRVAEAPYARITQAIFVPGGEWLATAGHGSEVELWSTTTGERVARLEFPERVAEIDVSPNGKLLAASLSHHIAAGRPYEVHVVRLPQGTLVGRLGGHGHFIYRTVFAPDNSWVATASHDRHVRVWSLGEEPGDAALLRDLDYPDLDPWNLMGLPDGALLVFRKRALEIHRDGGEPVVIRFPEQWGRSWSLNTEDETIAGAVGLQGVAVWCLKSGTLLRYCAAPIPRPEWVPNIRATDFRSLATTALWQGPGGPYLARPLYRRGAANMPTYFPAEELLLAPGAGEVALIRVGSLQQIVARFPFEDRLLSGCLLKDRVLLVNEEGRLWSYPRAES